MDSARETKKPKKSVSLINTGSPLREKSPPGGKKELIEAKYRNDVLEKQNTNINSKLSEQSRENKLLRTKYDQLVKDTAALQRKIEVLIKEKEDIKKQSAKDQETIKKLEAKVSLNLKTIGGNKIQQKVLQMKEKTQFQESRIIQLEEINIQQQHQINILTNALESKAQQTGVQGEVMFEFSKLQMDNKVLMEDNMNKEGIIGKMNEEIMMLRSMMEEASANNEHLQQELSSRVHDFERLEEEFIATKSENEDLKMESQRLLSALEEKSGELSQIKEIKEDLQSQKESIDHTARQQAQMMAAQLQKLAVEYNSMKDALEKTSTRAQFLEKKSMDDDLKIRDLSILNTQLAEKEASMSKTYKQLQAQCDDFANIIAENESETENLVHERDSLKKELFSLQSQLDDLLSKTSMTIEERKRDEEELRNKLRGTLEELNNSYQERENLRKELEESSLELSKAQDAIRNLRSAKEEAEEKIEKVEKTKVMLQKTLMEQITSLRERLKDHEQTIMEMKAQKEIVDKEMSRLQILANARQRSQLLLASANSELNTTSQSNMQNMTSTPSEFLRTLNQSTLLAQLRGAHEPSASQRLMEQYLQQINKQNETQNTVNTSIVQQKLTFDDTVSMNGSVARDIKSVEATPTRQELNKSLNASRLMKTPSLSTLPAQYFNEYGQPLNIFELAGGDDFV